MAKADLPHYEYRINENSDKERASIEGVILSKEWRRFEYPKEELTRHIQTRNNMKGILDYRVMIPAQSRIVKSNKERLTKKIPFYTKRELQTMTRSELIEIAETYEFDRPNFTPDRILVDKIFNFQKDIRLDAKDEQFIDDEVKQEKEPEKPKTEKKSSKSKKKEIEPEIDESEEEIDETVGTEIDLDDSEIDDSESEN